MNNLLKAIYVLLLFLSFAYLFYISTIIISGQCGADHNNNNNIEFQGEDFQRITDVPEKLYLLSAYFDHTDNSIKVIGCGKAYSTMPVYCQFYNYNEKYIPFSHRPGKIVDLEQAKRNYTHRAVWVNCPIKSNDVQLPKYVSITLDPHFNSTSSSQNLFRIKFNSITGTSSINFTVCVGPTYSYDSPLRFLEWIEFYKLMGVEHFIFSNVSIGPDTSCLMKQYQLNGEVGIEIQQWSSPFEIDVDIYMYSNLIVHADCVYRSRGVSQYVISVDLDEMIIPSVSSNVSNYMDLIKLIEKQKPFDAGKVSAYLFTNGYFVPRDTNANSTTDDQPLKLSSDNDLESQIYPRLVVSTKTTHGVQLYKRFSKYLANPYLIVRPYLHWARESQPGTDNYAVPPELGYLHHYRNKLPSYIKTDLSQIIDTSGQRFAKQLSVNVAQSLRKYGKLCDIL